MKCIRTFFIVWSTLLMASNTYAQKKSSKNQQEKFVVLGNCEMCKKRIEKAALTVKGVKMAQWDIPSNILQVVYNAQKIEADQIHVAIAQAGHDTRLHKASDAIYAELPLCCLYERLDIE